MFKKTLLKLISIFKEQLTQLKVSFSTEIENNFENFYPPRVYIAFTVRLQVSYTALLLDGISFVIISHIKMFAVSINKK